MKKFLLTMVVLAFAWNASAQNQAKPMVIPGKAKINVEQLNKKCCVCPSGLLLYEC